MATSGIVKSGYARESCLYVSWQISQTDTANNRSLISWEAGIIIGGSNDWYSNAVKINSIYIDGGDSLGSGTYSNLTDNGTYKKLSGQKWVAHNVDGSKNLTVTINGWFYANGNKSGSSTFALPDIPRQATLITAPNFDDTQNPTITYSNPAGTAVTSLQACISLTGADDDIPYRDVSKTGSSYTFVLTDAERNTLLNAVQGRPSISVRFILKTVIGDAVLESPLDRTFTVDNANPIITASVIDVNDATVALTGDCGKLIKFYSNALATMSAEGQKGASIAEDLYIIRNGDNTGYGTTHIFNNVENNVFTFSAEDSRGSVGTATVTPDMVEYIKLTCRISSNKPDGNGNMTVSCVGDYFNGSFGEVSNTLSVQYRYKVSGGAFSDWEDMTVTIDGDSYYARADITGLDYHQTYSFETKAKDVLAEISSAGSPVKSIPVFHWGENDFVFEVPVAVKGDLGVKGDLRLKGDGNYGNTLYFGDGSYCYLTEPEDDVLQLKANRIDLNANSVQVGGYPIYVTDRGRWSPSLNVSAISSYTTQEGWYMKIGQYVTVGFYIKATCVSGYSETYIRISGLPFTPLFSAAGGGMCSGAYISGGHNFQCYVAETSGLITTRVQACNNTSATNLNTSSSGCYYRSGGGEITLSGTIMFMANS